MTGQLAQRRFKRTRAKFAGRCTGHTVWCPGHIAYGDRITLVLEAGTVVARWCPECTRALGRHL